MHMLARKRVLTAINRYSLRPSGGLLSAADIAVNDKIASNRVIVENFFGRLKTLWSLVGNTMNSDKSDIQRLVFSGKREDFQTWMDAFRGELQKRWLKARVDAKNAKRAVCDVSYESWLTGVPDALPDTLTQESLQEATLLRDLQNVEIRSLLDAE
ncbi:hypothetical protein DYB31_011809 [Aphanomyces astaci]|uniref:DDE Tnp4 domain-containing protein n=2 Tax=Aphanomyces astaci TaxID=112090 RepID=A0A397F2Q5_APHAT|nr:hypothetical protein DYB31_011809 [Aphanomyces astaci]